MVVITEESNVSLTNVTSQHRLTIFLFFPTSPLRCCRQMCIILHNVCRTQTGYIYYWEENFCFFLDCFPLALFSVGVKRRRSTKLRWLLKSSYLHPTFSYMLCFLKRLVVRLYPAIMVRAGVLNSLLSTPWQPFRTQRISIVSAFDFDESFYIVF